MRTGEIVDYLVSICPVSLLIVASGFLKNKIANTKLNEYESLEKYWKRVAPSWIVDDNYTIIASAVTSSLNLGLYVTEKLIGKEKTEEIRIGMDYHPEKFEKIIITNAKYQI